MYVDGIRLTGKENVGGQPDHGDVVVEVSGRVLWVHDDVGGSNANPTRE